MKVKAETVRQHSFPVHRKGYDRFEVDAAMARIGQTLQRHEDETARLEGELAQARAASEAIEDTFVALQQARRQLLSEAQEEANRMNSEATESLRKAKLEAERILQEAQQRVEQLFADLRAEAEGAIAKAQEEVKAAEGRAESIKADAAIEGSRLIDDSKEEAQKRVAEAKKQSDEIMSSAAAEGRQIVEAARKERDSLAGKVPQLRNAVADIERRIREFSTTATEDLEVVDAMIEIAESEVSGGVASLVDPVEEAGGVSEDVAGDVIAVAEDPSASEVEEQSEHDVAAADHTDVVLVETVAAPDGSGALPAARAPIANGDVIGETPQSEADSGRTGVELVEPPPPSPLRARRHTAQRDEREDKTTIYQRRGGGLRARLEAGEKRKNR